MVSTQHDNPQAGVATTPLSPTLISPTLAINEETARRRRLGLPTLALGFGEAGLPVLPELAAQLAAHAGANGYGPVAGRPELREEAAGYWARRSLPTDPELVIAGPGSKPLLYALLHAMLATTVGAVALPAPSWVSYAAQAALLGRRVHAVPTLPGQGGVPDPDRLDAAVHAATAAGEPIRAVVVTLPDNPTGTLADPSTVAQLCDVAERHDLVVISDEIYRDLIHDDATPFVSPAELIGHRTVVTTGLSKSLAAGGWRIGVARLPDSSYGRGLRDQVAAIASEIWSAPAVPVQLAAGWAFDEPEVVRERVAASRRLHGAIARAVSDIFTDAGATHPLPQAGFYLYPDFEAHRAHLADRWSVRTGTELAGVLLGELGVATLPASAFGQSEDVLAVRIATSLLYGEDEDQRLEALSDATPARLPWIAGQLDRLGSAVAELTR